MMTTQIIIIRPLPSCVATRSGMGQGARRAGEGPSLQRVELVACPHPGFAHLLPSSGREKAIDCHVSSRCWA